MVLVAMMMALTAACTWLTRIPGIVPNGYVNFGDTILMFTALVLGPVAGFAAGSFGSALADILLGFPGYAPITFFVKGLEGLVCGLIYKKTKQKYAIVATLSGGLLMVAGYFAAEYFYLGPAAAVADIFGNALQGVINAVLVVLLNRALRKPVKKFISP
mgnify:FL=1